MPKIETLLSPNLFDQIENLDQKTVVVIDILRASTTINAILNNGANSVQTVSDVNEAIEYKKQGYLVGGERNGETIEGFDFGNSPLSYSQEIVQGKDIILTTTNGTKCISMSAKAHTLLVGAFSNLKSTVDFIKSSKNDVVLFCAAWKGRVNLEDSLYAGAVIEQCSGFLADDAGLLCLQAYQNEKGRLFECLKRSNHFQRLAGFGMEEDIQFCCEIDTMNHVAILKDGKIIRA
ncbi:2-phosphosulfolactate phosphatase [bacterium]|nr:2-phosphosulfolactate phosphatase [bacterium]